MPPLPGTGRQSQHGLAGVHRQFVINGLAATLARKRPYRVYARALDGDQEARLIAIAYMVTPVSTAFAD